MTLRILFDAHAVGIKAAGNETYSSGIARELSMLSGPEVYIYSRNNFSGNARTIRPWSSSVWIQRNAELPRYVKKHGITILHVPFVLPLVKQPVKYVLTIHDVLYMSHPQYYTNSMRTRLRVFTGRSIGRADAIVTVSEESREQIIHYYPESKQKVFVIKNGTRLWTETAMPVRGLDIPDFVLFVGTMQPRKGIETLLKAYFRDKGKLPPLVMVSGFGWHDGPLQRLLQRIMQKDPRRVFVLSNVSDRELRYLYESAKGLVVPSFAEGFGLPIIEALSLGTPVLASDLGIFKEIGGSNIEYFRAGDVEDLLRTLANLGSVRPSHGTLESVRLTFSWKNHVRQLMDLYEHVGKEKLK